MRQTTLLNINLWLGCLLSSAFAHTIPNPTRRADRPKLVVAHFIVGNTYSYKQESWRHAISLASSKGIDAFALDLGNDPWQTARVADAYKSAIGTTFKMFITFDMGSLPCAERKDADLLRSLVVGYNGHSNQLKYDGKPLVSVFGGQMCKFGEKHLDDAWNSVFKTNFTVDVHFVPAFFMEPPILGSMSSIDGAFSWDSAWPMGNYNISSSYDDEYRTYLSGKTYMAGVSPWFFTHYSKSTLNKNFMYRADDWLFASRWEILVQSRSQIDIAQVISWNDYGESHYVGPIDADQPGSQAWTTGYDHQGWLDLMFYYIAAFKQGSYPAITKDRIFLWGRLYPRDAVAPTDSIGRPINYEFSEDYVWGVVLLQAPAQLLLFCGDSHTAQDLGQGLSKVKLSLRGGTDCSVTAVLSKGGVNTMTFSPEGFDFKRSPPSYNFNAFVAASPL